MLSVRQIKKRWTEVWFTPVSPAPFCLFRILFGAIVALSSLITWPQAQLWFTKAGPISQEAARAHFGGLPYISLFHLIEPTAAVVSTFLSALIFFAVCLSAGLCTRLSAFCVWLLLLSFQNQNPFIWNCGDDFIRISALLVFLGPAGKLYSLDSWLEHRKSGKDNSGVTCEPWPQRLLMFQVMVIYAASFLYKTGATWWDGTAVYYAMNANCYSHFHLPLLFDQIWISRLGTWFTLALEVSMFTLIWVKEFRYKLLLVAAILHFLMLVTFNFPILELIMIASLVNFIAPHDVERALHSVLTGKRRQLHRSPSFVKPLEG